MRLVENKKQEKTVKEIGLEMADTFFPNIKKCMDLFYKMHEDKIKIKTKTEEDKRIYSKTDKVFLSVTAMLMSYEKRTSEYENKLKIYSEMTFPSIEEENKLFIKTVKEEIDFFLPLIASLTLALEQIYKVLYDFNKDVKKATDYRLTLNAISFAVEKVYPNYKAIRDGIKKILNEKISKIVEEKEKGINDK